MSKTKEAVSIWPYTPDSTVACGDLTSPSARSYNNGYTATLRSVQIS
ncbi:MAG TPA: hypothetical protein P5268_03575 [Candidatus Marinimicrobia bacterium]|nr:hypothetical protein [Candidatus Neomarinimicrobiota bacterium]HRU92100.1 hypothetical protein [Candidatus Neomarinimicrobiota bacterium]